MNRYNKLKRKVLSVFESAEGEWLRPNDAAERLDFLPRCSAWTYFKRLWKFGLLDRRFRGKGTLEYSISDSGNTAVQISRKLVGNISRVRTKFDV
jgi:hypothetical protein